MKRLTPVMLHPARRVGLQAAAMRRAARPVDLRVDLRVAPAVRLQGRAVRPQDRAVRPQDRVGRPRDRVVRRAVVISIVDRVRRVATETIAPRVATETIAPRVAIAMTGRRVPR